MQNDKRLLELLDIVREVCHSFAPYANEQRYRILEKLRALEVNIERDQQNEYRDNEK